MGRINDGLPVLYLAVATGLYYNPEYAILNSRIVTGFVLLAIVAAFKVLYQFSLYPEYFTPLKHIQTPPVGQIIHSHAQLQSLTATRSVLGCEETPKASFWKLLI